MPKLNDEDGESIVASAAVAVIGGEMGKGMTVGFDVRTRAERAQGYITRCIQRPGLRRRDDCTRLHLSSCAGTRFRSHDSTRPIYG